MVNGKVRLHRPIGDDGGDTRGRGDVGAVGSRGRALAGGTKLLLGRMVLKAHAKRDDGVDESAGPFAGSIQAPQQAGQLLDGDLCIEDAKRQFVAGDTEGGRGIVPIQPVIDHQPGLAEAVQPAPHRSQIVFLAVFGDGVEHRDRHPAQRPYQVDHFGARPVGKDHHPYEQGGADPDIDGGGEDRNLRGGGVDEQSEEVRHERDHAQRVAPGAEPAHPHGDEQHDDEPDIGHPVEGGKDRRQRHRGHRRQRQQQRGDDPVVLLLVLHRRRRLHGDDGAEHGHGDRLMGVPGERQQRNDGQHQRQRGDRCAAQPQSSWVGVDDEAHSAISKRRQVHRLIVRHQITRAAHIDGSETSRPADGHC